MLFLDTVYYNPSMEYMTITLLNDVTVNMTREERDAYEYSESDQRYVLYPDYDEFRKDSWGFKKVIFIT